MLKIRLFSVTRYIVFNSVEGFYQFTDMQLVTSYLK